MNKQGITLFIFRQKLSKNTEPKPARRMHYHKDSNALVQPPRT